MTSDPNDQPSQPSPPSEINPATSSSAESADAQAASRRKILIGSQRDPDAYKPKPKRDWVPVKEKGKAKRNEPEAPDEEQAAPPVPQPSDVQAAADSMVVMTSLPAVSLPEPIMVAEIPEQTLTAAMPSLPAVEQAMDLAAAAATELPELSPSLAEADVMESAITESTLSETTLVDPAALTGPRKRFPPPSIRGQLPPDLEQEYQAALADVPLDTFMSGTEVVSTQAVLEAESRHMARVVNIGREDVFLELGGREQAVIPLQLFTENPQPGATLEVVIVRFNRDDGLYEATLPMALAHVGDWSQVSEGMLVEARVTGHNAGGLECEVNRLRGFIPASQISLYRVENLEELVDQKFTCLVTEADAQRRNLVLSRRAVLEREREEARRIMLESLAPGQVREGVVRKILDFGAFVDLGDGVDGLIHVSQLGWGRVKHPSEVVQEGQTVRVRVERVDPDAKKISLSYKDLLENPWTGADRKYMVGTVVHGKVVKLMEYGAFVELEPGVEGLVHISELSHKRVARVSEVIKEGDEIDAVVLSVDTEARRVSLSMKNVNPPPEPEPLPAPSGQPAAQEPAAKPKPSRHPAKPLLGGLGRSPRGSVSGLKW
jgi:predicted RNA-binding protein with RPS1 domain